jgi:Complex 1 protein (LYR family)
MAARAGFRRLLRSAKVVFRGDSFALSQAREQLRAEFRRNAQVIDAGELQSLIRGINEVDEMLRFNIVQGSRNDRGNFEVRLENPEHQVTLASGHDDPHGVDIAPVDTAILGNPNSVKVTKTKGSKGSSKA